MKSRSIRIKDISVIELTKPKLTQRERVIEYLKKHGRASNYTISRAVDLSAHGSEILESLEMNGIIKGTTCECGKDKLYELVKYNKKL